MNAESLPLKVRDDWQSQLRNVITSGRQLLAMLGLEPAAVGYSDQAAADFQVKVPHVFVERMRHGDPQDPLLLQVLAQGKEMLEQPGYSKHPLQETGDSNPGRGILHKYQGRALLIVTGGCAINCRYCFRRHFAYSDNLNSRDEWREALGYVSRDSSIDEIILSGGDPLLAGDDYLDGMVSQIAAIPHIKRLRIHTRLPIVIPERVAPGLIDAIKRPSLQTVMVVHCNHAREIDQRVETATSFLAENGITLLNQSVLLAGVNDRVATLAELSEKLFAIRVLPYYLHLLDKVQGAAHFDVAERDAKELMAVLSSRLSGYLVPRLVREVPGAPSKIGV